MHEQEGAYEDLDAHQEEEPRTRPAEPPRAEVTPPRHPPVSGLHQRNLLIASGILAAVIGVSFFITPFVGKDEGQGRTAPAPAERTYLDEPTREPEEPPPPAAPETPWWADYAGLSEPEPEVPDPWAPSAAAPDAAPEDPRSKALQRALRSAALRKAEPVEGGRPDSAAPAEVSLLDAASALMRGTAGQAAAGDLLPPAGTTPHASGSGPDALIGGGAGTGSAGGSWPPGLATGAGLLRPPGQVGGGGGAPGGFLPSSWAGTLDPPVHLGRLQALRHPPPTRRTLRAGTLIPARLETAIDSDAPGPVRARVLRDVTDSPTGRTVLIPAGAQLLGSTASQLAYGEGRLLVAFERLTFPGATYELPGLAALAPSGALGLSDRVDRHTLPTLGRAALLAAVGAGLQIAQPDRGQNAGLSSGELVAAQVGLELNRVAQQILSQSLTRRPTVRIRPGHRFYVYVNRDLTL